MRNTVLPDLLAEWTEDDVRLALDAWRRSGGTIAAFAREHHMSARQQLYWWRKRLPKDLDGDDLTHLLAGIAEGVAATGGGRDHGMP